MDPLSLLLGTLVGAAVAWAVASHRSRRVETRAAAAEERARGETARCADLEARRAEAEARADAEDRRATGAERELAAATERVVQQQRLLAEQAAFVEKAKTDLEAVINAAAARALQGNSQQFLDLAAQRLGTTQAEASADLEARRQEIATLLTPMREQLETLSKSTLEIEKARVAAYADIQRHVGELKHATTAAERQATTLATALGSKTVQGSWGELGLRNVLGYAGMTEHCDFVAQTTLDSGGRPDVLVRLPGGGWLPVDAKAPTDAYRRYCSATEDAARSQALDGQVAALRAHVRELARRDYASDPENVVGLVVLFLPHEGLLSAALQRDPDLFTESLSARILLATPISLIGLLRTIASCHQQAALAREAAQIAEVSKDLYDRVAKFAEHLGRMGNALGTALGSYNDAVGSYTARLLPMTRRLEELKVPSEVDDRLALPKPLEGVPREVVVEASSDARS